MGVIRQPQASILLIFDALVFLPHAASKHKTRDASPQKHAACRGAATTIPDTTVRQSEASRKPPTDRERRTRVLILIKKINT